MVLQFCFSNIQNKGFQMAIEKTNTTHTNCEEVSCNDYEDEIKNYKKILLELYNEYTWDFMEDIYFFSLDLKKKYGEDEVREYRMYHVLIGSTPEDNYIFTLHDFVDDDSVANFINTKWNRYLQEKETEKKS
jgi:hypothetical protein